MTMTGMEIILEKLRNKGYSAGKIKTNAEFIADIVTILSDDETRRKVDVAKMHETEAQMTYERAVEERSRAQTTLSMANTKELNAENIMAAAKQKEEEAAETLKRVEQLSKVMSDCETQEARDRVRMANLFRGMTDIQTPQNNTAYIAGLASILSGCTPAIAELKDLAGAQVKPYDTNDTRRADRRL